MRRALPGLAALVLAAGPVLADPGSTTRDGKALTVSKATGLAVAGEQVTVTGRGYDESKGVYVAFCVDNGPGRVPTPCGGGADTEGSSGNSVWVSSFPPAYGTGLARPYDKGGSFEVTIDVRAQLDEETDCRVVRCAVVTRNDHTRSDDRSQDLVVPVSFGTTSSGTAAPVPPRPARPAARPLAGGGTTVAPRATPGTPGATAGAAGATGLVAGATPSAGGTGSAVRATASTTGTGADPAPAVAKAAGSTDRPWGSALLSLLLVGGVGAAGARVLRSRRA